MTTRERRGVFLGIPLPEECREKLIIANQIIGQADHTLKLQPPESAHITLLYIGQLTQDDFETLQKKAPVLARDQGSFAIEVRGYLCLGTAADPRVIALDVQDPSGHLRRLAAKMKSELGWLCLHSERHAFKPHLTLARITDTKAYHDHEQTIREIVSSLHFCFRVDRIHLYEARGSLRQQMVEDYPCTLVNKAAAF